MRTSSGLLGVVWGTAILLAAVTAFLARVGDSPYEPHASDQPQKFAQEKQALPPDVEPSQKRQPVADDEFKSPLLRGLRQSILESEAFDKAELSDSLLDQLRDADHLLANIRAENMAALRHANRQVRVGASRRSPNIVLISVDRLGWADLGAFGQQTIKTPHLDRLAREGIKLTRFYAGGADLKAARWCLHTGRAASRVPAARVDKFRLREEQSTLAEALWESGYVTSFFGLWENSDRPSAHGYENWSGFLKQTELKSGFPEVIHVDSAELKIVDNANNKHVHSAERLLIGELSAWLGQAARQKRQFFAHVAIAAFPETSPSDTSAAAYRGSVEAADATIGKVLQELDDLNLTSNTCVIALAETGPSRLWQAAAAELRSTGPLQLAEHGLAEGNLRVPAIIRWPGRIRSETETTELLGAWDLLPTCCEVAAAMRQPGRLDGVSMSAALTGGKQTRRSGLLYWEHGQSDIGQAVRFDTWKGVRAAGNRTMMLFDVELDPAEKTDRAAESPDVIKRMIVKQ